MALAYVNLSSKQYINFMCRTDFERNIFHSTYREFQKKSKPYNQGKSSHTFSQMLKENAKAYSLHQKLESSVMDILISLKNKMPDLIDLQGQSILFDWAELHILSSDLLNKAAHVVEITYTSPKMILHKTIDDYLILSYHSKDSFNEIFMVKLTDDLVVNYDKNLKLA
ncbi:hypothetical protein [Pedobacter sp. R20-19]|uniref:hypothetical protein n=1 Tax=Pedobacter sp. R20-19 TaxID=1270196 RepID=UPI000492FB48|nr:hypothetical protein [Pedobacter sp. R20-19]